MTTLFSEPRKTVVFSKEDKEKLLEKYDEVKNSFKGYSVAHNTILKQVCSKTGVHKNTVLRFLKERAQNGKVSSPKKGRVLPKTYKKHAPYTRNEKRTVLRAYDYVSSKYADMTNSQKVKEVKSITAANERTIYTFLH